MDKSTHQIRCKQWMTIINNCLASGITKKPGAKKTASQKNRFITGSGYSVAKLTLSRNIYGKSCVLYTSKTDGITVSSDAESSRLIFRAIHPPLAER